MPIEAEGQKQRSQRQMGREAKAEMQQKKGHGAEGQRGRGLMAEAEGKRAEGQDWTQRGQNDRRA